MKRWIAKHETLVIVLGAFLMTALLCLFVWSNGRESMKEPCVDKEVVVDSSEADTQDAYAKWWYYNNFILRW